MDPAWFSMSKAASDEAGTSGAAADIQNASVAYVRLLRDELKSDIDSWVVASRDFDAEQDARLREQELQLSRLMYDYSKIRREVDGFVKDFDRERMRLRASFAQEIEKKKVTVVSDAAALTFLFLVVVFIVVMLAIYYFL